MSETMRDDVDLAAGLSSGRVRLEILWLRAGKNPERFREAIIEAGRGVLPLALLVCELPVEVAEEALTGVELEVDLDGVLSAGETEMLSRSSVLSDRCLAAHSTFASADVLSRLARDEDWDVRVEVAENRSTPAEVLSRLAVDGSPTVRHRVASNLSIPDAVVELLAGDEYRTVRHRVASNPSTPDSVVERLARDPDSLVRETAAKSLKVRRKSG